MAERLNNQNLHIDLLVSSPAKRAHKTARIFAEGLGFKKKDVVVDDQLYAAEPQDFYAVVRRQDDKHHVIALFSHNPGITDFANSLTGVRVDNMPTCSMFAVQAETDEWAEFALAEKKFLFFDYPKNPAFRP